MNLMPTPGDGHNRPRPREVRESLNAISQAVKYGWEVPPEARKAAVNTLLQIISAQDRTAVAAGAQGPERYLYPTKQRLMAVKLLIDMNAQDVALEMQDGGNSRPPTLVEVAREVELRRCVVLTVESVQAMADRASEALRATQGDPGA